MSVSPYQQNCGSTATELAPCLVSLGTFLRRQHPRDTAACVEAETGIPAGSVEKWLQGIAFPRAKHQFRLISVYGPSALAAMVPRAPRWLSEAVRAEDRGADRRATGAPREAEELLTQMRWLLAIAEAFCLWRAGNHTHRANRWFNRADDLRARQDRRQGELFEDGA